MNGLVRSRGSCFMEVVTGDGDKVCYEGEDMYLDKFAKANVEVR